MLNIQSDEKTVYSEKELMSEIHSSLEGNSTSNAVIMAGHFMLFYDTNSKQLVPGIFEDIENTVLREQVRERVGIFPSYTWSLGVRLAEQFKARYCSDAKLLLLINDWQYVPDTGNASDHRCAFYANFQKLPLNYSSRLAASTTISEGDVLPSRRHPLAYPETWLKNRFKNEATRLVKAGKLQRRFLTENPGKSEILFTDTEGTSLPLVSCGMTGCAGEITEMISEAHRAGTRHLIIFAPVECHHPIRKGVEIALSLYKLDAMKLQVADLGGSGEMTLEEIYSRGVNLVTYVS